MESLFVGYQKLCRLVTVQFSKRSLKYDVCLCPVYVKTALKLTKNGIPVYITQDHLDSIYNDEMLLKICVDL